MKRAAVILCTLVLGFCASPSQSQERPTGLTIENGSTVHLEYTLKDEAGTVLDSNKGRPPLTYTQGQGRIIPGLERALNGMHSGEEKQITVRPEDGYGPVDPTAIAEVPKETLPADALTVGTQLLARGRSGQTMVVRVKEIKDATVIIDFNHPLAGKTLYFDVKVLTVEHPKK